MPRLRPQLEVIMNEVTDENAQADLERAFGMLFDVEPVPLLSTDGEFDNVSPARNNTSPQH